MQKLWLAIAGICLLSWVSWLVWQWHGHSGGSDTIEYRGQKIKLSKSYSDFDDYKNDPDNIAPSETARVQKLVMEAPAGYSFPNKLALFQGIGEIEFPGYGLASGTGRARNGNELLPVDIEIPRAARKRYLVFELKNGTYELIDDFVGGEIAYPYSVREDAGYYIFSAAGKDFFRRPGRD